MVFIDDVFILLKEVIDNSIDGYVMGYGKEVDIEIKDMVVTVVKRLQSWHTIG